MYHKHHEDFSLGTIRLHFTHCDCLQVTLALDSQALCCANTVENVLNQLRWAEFDISFAVQVSGVAAFFLGIWKEIYTCCEPSLPSNDEDVQR